MIDHTVTLVMLNRLQAQVLHLEAVVQAREQRIAVLEGELEVRRDMASNGGKSAEVRA